MQINNQNILHLKADAVGASVIEYSGNPGTVRRDATGASSVRSVMTLLPGAQQL